MIFPASFVVRPVPDLELPVNGLRILRWLVLMSNVEVSESAQVTVTAPNSFAIAARWHDKMTSSTDRAKLMDLTGRRRADPQGW
jgi:hypothetical protein